jgi:hypothetical protein
LLLLQNARCDLNTKINNTFFENLAEFNYLKPTATNQNYFHEEIKGRCSSPGRVKNFIFSTSSRPVMGATQPPIQWVPGCLSLGAKRPGLEAVPSSAVSAEVNKLWIYTSYPLYSFMA